jgi:hypothetical protein
MLKRLSVAAGAAAFLAIASAGASAMPIGSTPQASTGASEQTSNPDLILVADGCGIGFHRGPWGGCRPNLSPYWPCHWIRTPWGPRRVCN